MSGPPQPPRPPRAPRRTGRDRNPAGLARRAARAGRARRGLRSHQLLRAPARAAHRLPVVRPGQLRRLRLLHHQRVHRARLAGAQGQRADLLGEQAVPAVPAVPAGRGHRGGALLRPLRVDTRRGLGPGDLGPVPAADDVERAGGKNLPNVVWSLSYEMVFYLLLTALFIARVHKRSSWYALGFAAAAVAIGGLLPQAFFTHNVATPQADRAGGGPGRARRAGLRGRAARHVTAARRGARRGGGDHAARLQQQLDLALGGPVDPRPDVHRDHVLPGRTGPVPVAPGHRDRR